MPTVFITGANRGIGLELAKVYTSNGFRVIAGIRNIKTADAISKFAEVVQLNVTSPKSVAELQIKFANETIDVLINNAGTIGPLHQSTIDMDFEAFLETFNINTIGPLRVTQSLLLALKRAVGAKIATLTSNMGTMSYAKSDHVAYRASKAAANKVMQCLATDMQPLGIAVVAMHPGWVRTDMGGAGADISASESAAGIFEVIRKLSIGSTGLFLNYDGKSLAW